VPPSTPPSGIFFCTRGEYVTMSNCVFNFNFLALLLSEILGGSLIYTRGPYAPWTSPSGEIFFTLSEYFTMSNCVFNFNILALVLFGILGGSQAKQLSHLTLSSILAPRCGHFHRVPTFYNGIDRKCIHQYFFTPWLGRGSRCR